MQKLLLIAFDGTEGAGLLEAALAEKLHLETSLSDARLPEVRFRSGQASADDILSEVCRLRIAANADVALGVTDVDIFVPDLNFVFGLASEDGACALVSTNRLKGDGLGPYAQRLLKEAVHELGHVLGLAHCDDPKCVMHFSNSLRDTDLKGARFCPKCTTLLAK